VQPQLAGGADEAPSRKRGRPRKHPLVAPAAAAAPDRAAVSSPDKKRACTPGSS
jgi:hypothetical protein